ncbi:MAG: beta-phosphoglucomutase [Bacteroidia bacterium]|nr:beta-phosphoglucomutase [Bacteroidia bacterium]NNM23052.1 beta-phosphoglucomutase [Flavobacteriaceae bacterium]
MSQTKRKGFIFDLDGVIVDTAKYHFLAWKNLAESLGIDFTEAQNEQLKGVSRVRSLEKILSWGNKEIPSEEFDRLMAKKNVEYLLYIDQMTKAEILPDVERVLSFLEEQNQAIALGSASKNAQMILEKVGLYDKFHALVDGNNVSKAKPDPEVFLLGAEKLGVAPSNCIVFEDAIAGIQAANAAQMMSIGIGSPEVLGEANYVFNNFTDLSNEFLASIIAD